jgi:hypothetical protein
LRLTHSLNPWLPIDCIPIPGKNGGMLPLLAAMIVFFFLALGSAAFLVCTLIPPCRKYALSTALWFAVCGPCCVLLLILAILGLVAGGLALRATQMRWEDASRFFSAVGWVSTIGGGIVVCVVASIAAWLHQALIHRFTFALFRLYATLVTAGIGCVISLFIITVVMVRGVLTHVGWVEWLSIPILIFAFGLTAYWGARTLRGNAPKRLTWITPEEFAGHEESKEIAESKL